MIRALIELPQFEEYLNYLNVFVSISSPHLGVYCGNSMLMSSGIWFWKKFKVSDSVSFSQMMMEDIENESIPFLHKISQSKGKFIKKGGKIFSKFILLAIGYFRHVLLLGSDQDKYTPIESALLLPVIGKFLRGLLVV